MLIGLGLLACLLSVPLAGGRLGALGELRLKALWLVFLGLGVQIVIVSLLPGGSAGLHRGAHLASYALLAAFLVVNRKVPYLWLIGVGGVLNLIAIAANRGVMPADRGALEAAGVHQAPGEFLNSTAVSGAHLQFLGDVFAVPAWFPVANVFSVGDVLIVAGAFLALHRICGSRLPRGRAPRSPEPAA